MAIFGRKKAQPAAGEKAAGATKPDDASADGPIDPSQISDVDKAKARKWFDHAQTVADTRNYDYAIECYTNGLELWPEAVEEGHMKLRVVATQRHAAGKKTPSAGERMKRPVGRKDALRNMLNAEFLWAKDPTNVTYMEALFKNAVKTRCDATAMWFGPIVFEAVTKENKPTAQRFLMLRAGYLELAERCRELLQHHDERLNKVAEILEDGQLQTVHEIARQLFGDMEHFHVVLGCAEAASHLEYLGHAGRVTAEDGRYRLARA